MPRITLNGRERMVRATSVQELLDELCMRRTFIVVELNREPVSRNDFNDTTISDGDKVEIVSPVGGG